MKTIKDNCGTAALEFAIVAPVLVAPNAPCDFLVTATYDFHGILFNSKIEAKSCYPIGTSK